MVYKDEILNPFVSQEEGEESSEETSEPSEETSESSE